MPEARVAQWKTVQARPNVGAVIKNYEEAFRARQYLDVNKPLEAYAHAKNAAAAPTAADAYPNWVLARAASSLDRQGEAVSALQRAISSPEPAPQVYEDLIAIYERGGHVATALVWTDKASQTFGGAPRWRPVKIRLLRKAGRTAEADTQTLDCSVNAPDWRRLCQEANATSAPARAVPAQGAAPKPAPTPTPTIPSVVAPKPPTQSSPLRYYKRAARRAPAIWRS